MKGKPKTSPRLSHTQRGVRSSEQSPVPYDQNRARKEAPKVREASAAAFVSDSPTDENFVNDDIIEENSHVIPPVKISPGRRVSKGRPTK